eukprot:CAMPEP_0175109362 /NCGR_PEP_ID=MMETSP0086_2-20121207/13297_1 /TAXON_ID=136419 /ORGANISM="Unknown Unknown, Strain D1" /LENGTH=303 /DNA_ID=CAMNT_0016386969 /DNA_START=79 /DNA_END=991 /DNA_ORIENTATION=-
MAEEQGDNQCSDGNAEGEEENQESVNVLASLVQEEEKEEKFFLGKFIPHQAEKSSRFWDLEWADAPFCHDRLPGKFTSPLFFTNMFLSDEMLEISEITPHLYISSCRAAQLFELLTELGITHVLNAAYGSCNKWVRGFEQRHGQFTYLNLDLADVESQDILSSFEASYAFFYHVRRQGGKVLCHCVQGKSRSISLAMAYLIRAHQMTVQAALEHCRSRRAVVHTPNKGFMLQLEEFAQNRLNVAASAEGIPTLEEIMSESSPLSPSVVSPRRSVLRAFSSSGGDRENREQGKEGKHSRFCTLL